jgi:hypothetical protein
VVSAPAERGGDVLQDRLDDVRVVIDAELVGDGQEQRVGLRDGLVLRQFFNEDIRLGGITATEDRACLLVYKADMVLLLSPTAEVCAIAIV